MAARKETCNDSSEEGNRNINDTAFESLDLVYDSNDNDDIEHEDLDDDDDDDAPSVPIQDVDASLARRTLLRQLVELENPILTPNMIDFLSQDHVCEEFAKFITRLSDEDSIQASSGPMDIACIPTSEHVSRENETTIELIHSYRASMFLTPEAKSDAWGLFLKDQVQELTGCIFKVFQKNSKGCLAHGCHVLHYFLKYYTDQVYAAINESVSRYFSNLLTHIDTPCVAELFIALICKPHTTAVLYKGTPDMKWKLFRQLSNWKVVVLLAEKISGKDVDDKQVCVAADVFMETVSRLCADDNGAILLQPLVHCPEVLEGLLEASVGESASSSSIQRSACMQTVLHIIIMSRQERVPGPPTSPYESFSILPMNLVSNQMLSLSGSLFHTVEEWLDIFLSHIKNQHTMQQNIILSSDVMDGKNRNADIPPESVRHSSYVVKVPFSEFRLHLINLLVELTRKKPDLLVRYDVEVFRALIKWFFEYTHNNLYHATFYQLLFIILRKNDESVLKMVLQKLKLPTLLIESLQTQARDSSNKGYCLRCCNALRLQADTLAPDAYLGSFLKNHHVWRMYLPTLLSLTTTMQVHGLGFTIPCDKSAPPPEMTLGLTPPTEGIALGSVYAASLGFVDDVAWPEEESTLSTAPSSASKKKKKKKKKSRSSSRSSSADKEGKEKED